MIMITLLRNENRAIEDVVKEMGLMDLLSEKELEFKVRKIDEIFTINKIEDVEVFADMVFMYTSVDKSYKGNKEMFIAQVVRGCVITVEL